MPVRCPKCNQLMCESIEGTDFRMKFTCKKGHKFLVFKHQEVDKVMQPVVVF